MHTHLCSYLGNYIHCFTFAGSIGVKLPTVSEPNMEDNRTHVAHDGCLTKGLEHAVTIKSPQQEPEVFCEQKSYKREKPSAKKPSIYLVPRPPSRNIFISTHSSRFYLHWRYEGSHQSCCRRNICRWNCIRFENKLDDVHNIIYNLYIYNLYLFPSAYSK